MAEIRGEKKFRYKLAIFWVVPYFLFLKNLKLECFPIEKQKLSLYKRVTAHANWDWFTSLATSYSACFTITCATCNESWRKGSGKTRGPGYTQVMNYNWANHTVQTKLNRESKFLVALSLVFIELLGIFNKGVFGIPWFLSWMIISNCHFVEKSMTWYLRFLPAITTNPSPPPTTSHGSYNKLIAISVGQQQHVKSCVWKSLQ